MPSVMDNAPSLLEQRVQTRSCRVAVMGLGYVGIPLSLTFIRAGFTVLGFDTDAKKIERLNGGECYIQHIGSEPIAEAVQSGKFSATMDPALLASADVIVVCVPTPLNSKREPDLSYIESSALTIASILRPGQLIVLESSTYPGTTEEVVLPLLESTGVPSSRTLSQSDGDTGRDAAADDTPHCFYLAYSPEREDPGNKQFTTANIPKLVGGIDELSGRIAHTLYASAFAKAILVRDAKIAEMAKILENTYRCVNIALVNELKQLCLRMGIDISEVIQAASTKPFGFQPFYPGPGLGGHCIPIDPFYLSWKAKDYDFTTRFIELAGQINTEMPYRVVDSVTEALNTRGRAVHGSKILILGIAYKKDIDDLRESPAIKLIELLSQRGAVVSYHDPHCPKLEKGRHNDFEMQSRGYSLELLQESDCVVIATDHSAFDATEVCDHSSLVIDTRNMTSGIYRESVIRC